MTCMQKSDNDRKDSIKIINCGNKIMLIKFNYFGLNMME